LHSEYTDLVLQELRLREPAGLRGFETAYLGGGSPSALSVQNLRKLLLGLKEQGLRTEALQEFTMEWNPEQASEEKINLALEFGINRFSLGIQSLNDDLLKMLGRRHSAKNAISAFEILNKKFNTGSADLMFCLPSQSVEDFLSDVKALVNLNAKHISFYGLALKNRKKFQPQPEDLYPEMYLRAAEILHSAGLRRYEISNFAVPGCESRHNKVYWQRLPYLGAGPSAHSYLNGVRSFVSGKYAPWRKWVENLCPPSGLSQDIPSAEGREIEAVWLALRTEDGLSLKGYEQEFGKKFNLKKTERFVEKGWLTANEDCVKATGEGWLWIDSIAREL
jgi:oxygen-independent coproporphyrinogen-3 oxidase